MITLDVSAVTHIFNEMMDRFPTQHSRHSCRLSAPYIGLISFAGRVSLAFLAALVLTSSDLSAAPKDNSLPKEYSLPAEAQPPAPRLMQEAPLQEPEATPDIDGLLNVPDDESEKVFASDVERDLKNQDLNTLFERLEAAADSSEAELLSNEIVLRFHQSGNDTIDLLMQRVVRAIRTKQTAIALDLVNSIILLEPDFAEGWNKRAHLHFMTGDLAKSIADIEKVLELEPRHFGALNGLAIILRRLDRKQRALTVYEEVLKIHPFLEAADKARAELTDELDGRGA